MKKPEKTRVSIQLTEPYIRCLDTLIEKGIFNERQDAMREALRALFMKHDMEPFTVQSEPRIIEREEVKKP